MAQRVRVRSVLLEDPSAVPSSRKVACNSSSKGAASFMHIACPCVVLHAQLCARVYCYVHLIRPCVHLGKHLCPMRPPLSRVHLFCPLRQSYTVQSTLKIVEEDLELLTLLLPSQELGIRWAPPYLALYGASIKPKVSLMEDTLSLSYILVLLFSSSL